MSNKYKYFNPESSYKHLKPEFRRDTKHAIYTYSYNYICIHIVCYILFN
jgi:hypothetical protein